MSLKQLRLNKELELKRSKLDEFSAKEAELTKRSEELAATLEEAKTEEDIQLVTEEIDKLEAEQKENDEAKAEVEEEIEKLEGELDEIKERSSQPKQKQIRSKGVNGMNKLQVRELLKSGEYYERSEVKDFYEKFKNLRAVGGVELTIPEVIVNRIMDIVGDYTTVYPLVEKMQVKGTARILIDTDTEEATWMEMSAAIPEGNVGTISRIDFDGFKVGKLTFVDNYLLQDSIINLDQYVVKKLARSIGKALDLAILHGKGATEKQPLGIIAELENGKNAARVITVANPSGYGDLVKPIALIDNGKNGSGNVIALMSRATYYNRCMPFTVQTNAAGTIVGKLPNLSNPDMLGLRVVFSNYMKDDEILFGDFSKYTLVEREDITVESSTHVHFAQDQTGFRGKGRFDGKPTDIEGFVLVKIEGQSDFIGGNTVPTGGGTSPSPTTTTTETPTPTPTPTATLRLVKTGDVTTRSDNTLDGATIDAQGNVTNKRTLSYKANEVKTVLFMPAGVTEMEFTATNKHHNILVGSDDAQENGVGISFRDGLKQYYNLALGTTSTLGEVKDVAKVTNEHTPAVGTKYKVVNDANKATIYFYDTNAYKEWFTLDKKTITDVQWYKPRLGVIGGISPSNETNTKILGEAKIKTAN